MEADPTRMCELLVGLGDVDLVGIDVRGEDAPEAVAVSWFEEHSLAHRGRQLPTLRHHRPGLAGRFGKADALPLRIMP